MSRQPKFTRSPRERLLIHEIAVRAVALCAPALQLDRLTIEMDLSATHANGCRLQLKRLLAADDFNLVHDVLGINRHIDRNTGQLTDCFRPRFAA